MWNDFEHNTRYIECKDKNITLYEPKIGHGRYATVYKGEWSYGNIKEIVAIKIQHKEKEIKTRAIQQKELVKKEITLHEKLNHPSIVKLKDSFEDKNNYYIVLEYCDSGTLDEYLKRNNILCENEVYEIMKQVVDGLKYLHSRKIIHRDLSLKNILLTKDYKTKELKVKIADFGCSTELKTLDETKKTVVGTPVCMSPEVVIGTEYSFGIDIWSLGVIFYTLLFGDFPIKGQSMQEVLTEIVLTRLKIPSTSNAEARKLLCLLLNKNSERRPDIYKISNHIYFNNDKKHEYSSETQGQARSSKHKRGGIGANFSPTFFNLLQSGITDSGISSNNECYQPKQRPMKIIAKNSWEDTRSCLYKRMSFSNPDLVTREESPSHFLSTGASYASNSTRKSQCKRTLEDVIAVEDRRKFIIDTIRLPPCELKKKNAIYKINAEGQAIAEYYKVIQQEKYIKYILTVDPEGEYVGVFDPEDRNYTTDDVPDFPKKKLYSFIDLPDKYWEKYKFIKRFVDCKRAKTPKIIIYTKTAKCSMMENFPDPNFELKFSEGWSIIKERSGIFKLQNKVKETVAKKNVAQKYLNLFNEMTKLCNFFHEYLKPLERNNEVDETILFPAIFGDKAAFFQALKNSTDEHCMSGKNKRVLQFSNSHSVNSWEQKDTINYKKYKEIFHRDIKNSVAAVHVRLW
ncbi:serine/threonine-protein kinase PLK4 isoform X2 [Parasteatoda tepidariorum]|uniref:serine/threonine-protein kinase PLK4 isoform X2 n=1 Tax=Parasteatoda tepidariorum TaxID=114398 RepID=UPI001C71C69D|nr:serine/threonine-protein kinase PLK4 isoform X2 [Parasteatoda tepidariorum]